MCEVFGGYPDEAWRAWQRLPVGTLEGIIEFRAYRDAKVRYEAAKTAEAKQALSGDTWVDRVRVETFARVKKKLDEAAVESAVADGADDQRRGGPGVVADGSRGMKRGR